jgi:hypothetical protein
MNFIRIQARDANYKFTCTIHYISICTHFPVCQRRLVKLSANTGFGGQIVRYRQSGVNSTWQGDLHPNMPGTGRTDRCTSVLVQHWCTHMGNQSRGHLRPPAHGQGIQYAWTEGDRNLAIWNGGYTPCHLGEGKGRILKGEILEDFSELLISSPLPAEVPALLSLSVSTINLC